MGVGPPQVRPLDLRQDDSPCPLLEGRAKVAIAPDDHRRSGRLSCLDSRQRIARNRLAEPFAVSGQ